MAQPSYPGINYEEDPSIRGGRRPSITNPKAWMQDFVNRHPDSPLTSRIIDFYGVRPQAGLASGVEGAVPVQIRGTPGQQDYTVSHGPIAQPRQQPQSQDDPYFQENYGVNDNITPWLIQPQTWERESGIPSNLTHRYGVPASAPIALPPKPQPQPQSQYPAMYNDRWGNN